MALSKPIIVIKAGRTAAGGKAAASHTGAMTGSDDVLDAAFRRVGVLRVDRISDLFYMAEVLAKQPTVTKTVDRLEAQGLVERRVDGGDARRSLVAITAGGRRKVAPLLKAAQAHGEQRLAALAVPDAHALRASLRALVQHYDDAEPAD